MKTRPSRAVTPYLQGSYYDRIEEARRRMARRELEAAAAILERLIERISGLPERRRRPDSALAIFLAVAAADLHQIRQEQGRLDEAIALCDRLQGWDAENADFWRQRGFVLCVEQGRVDEGLAGLRALAEGEAGDFDQWLVLAQQAIMAERVATAEEALEMAHALAPDVEETLALVHFARFRLRQLEERWLEASQAWDAAAALDQDIRVTQELVVRMFLEAGLPAEAKRYVTDEALSQPVATYYRALMAHRRGDRVLARHLWRQLAELDPDQAPQALASLAMARCWLEQPLQALSLLLHRVQTGQHLHTRYAVVMALAWAMTGDLEAARADLAIARRALTRSGGERRLNRLDWQDFDELVQDGAIKAELQAFFEA